jgi:hypothetical protein
LISCYFIIEAGFSLLLLCFGCPIISFMGCGAHGAAKGVPDGNTWVRDRRCVFGIGRSRAHVPWQGGGASFRINKRKRKEKQSDSQRLSLSISFLINPHFLSFL